MTFDLLIDALQNVGDPDLVSELLGKTTTLLTSQHLHSDTTSVNATETPQIWGVEAGNLALWVLAIAGLHLASGMPSPTTG